jgi:predicted nucleic acid-binding protein
MIYILDACALIAFLAEEMGKGFEAVDALFDRAITEKTTICISMVNLVEVFYHFIRANGEEKAVEIMRELDNFPVVVIDTISPDVYHDAARLKTRYPMSLGDVFLCATAKSLSATVVTKDREIEAVERSENLPVLWIR